MENRSIDLSVSQLHQWSEKNEGDAEFYAKKRRELLAQGFSYIRLVESGGESDMGVVIDFDAIKSFKPTNVLTAELLERKTASPAPRP